MYDFKINCFIALSKKYTLLPVGNLTNSFCGFTSRGVVLRGRTRLELRILTAQDGAATELLLLAKVMTNAVLPRAPSFPDTHKLLKNLNLAGILLDF